MPVRFTENDLELSKDILKLAKSDPAMLKFVTKAVGKMRSDDGVRLSCLAYKEIDEGFLKYLLYVCGCRRDSEFVPLLLNPETALHKAIRKLLEEEADLASRSKEMELTSEWIASGTEKSAAGKVLSLLQRDRWAQTGSTQVSTSGPTQIVFEQKEAKPTPAKSVGWEGVGKFTEEHRV